jgi:hypothetical protein
VTERVATKAWWARKVMAWAEVAAGKRLPADYPYLGDLLAIVPLSLWDDRPFVTTLMCLVGAVWENEVEPSRRARADVRVMTRLLVGLVENRVCEAVALLEKTRATPASPDTSGSANSSTV